MQPVISLELLNLLVCPLSKLPVTLDDNWLVCESSNPPRRYPVRNGIPVMLVDESEVMGTDGLWTSGK